METKLMISSIQRLLREPQMSDAQTPMPFAYPAYPAFITP